MRGMQWRYFAKMAQWRWEKNKHCGFRATPWQRLVLWFDSLAAWRHQDVCHGRSTCPGDVVWSTSSGGTSIGTIGDQRRGDVAFTSNLGETLGSSTIWGLGNSGNVLGQDEGEGGVTGLTAVPRWIGFAGQDRTGGEGLRVRTCVPESWQAEVVESCSFSCAEAEAQAEAACWQAPFPSVHPDWDDRFGLRHLPVVDGCRFEGTTRQASSSLISISSRPSHHLHLLPSRPCEYLHPVYTTYLSLLSYHGVLDPSLQSLGGPDSDPTFPTRRT